MKSKVYSTVIVVSTGTLLMGCSHFLPSAAAGGGSSAAPEAVTCEQRAMIENADDQDSRILVLEGRGGYLYTYSDKNGTQISPAPNSFSVSKGGVTEDGAALRVHGTLGDADAVYAGVGFSFADPKRAYDASRYTGVSFIAKRAPDSAAAIRMKVPDGNTDPDGGQCKDCFNDFGANLTLTEEWVRYEVNFADLKQEKGWGDPQPPAIDTQKLYGLQWQLVTRGASFDFWIDEVTFIGCPSTSEEGSP